MSRSEFGNSYDHKHYSEQTGHEQRGQQWRRQKKFSEILGKTITKGDMLELTLQGAVVFDAPRKKGKSL